MKKLLPLFLFIFSIFSYAQEKVNIYDSYVQELIGYTEAKHDLSFDVDDIEWRIAVVDRITSSNYKDPSFFKTIMVLHMLEYRLGENVYQKCISNYRKEIALANQKITVKSFIESLEQSTNEDLSDFYNDWFIGNGFPSYDINWFQNSNGLISISVKQSQSDNSVSFFELPIPIEVKSKDGQSQFIRLKLGRNKQSFTGHIPFTIDTVLVDPERQLISKNNTVKNEIDKELLNVEISLYPNPVINSLNIQNSSEAIIEKVSIYNMRGKLILQEINPIAAIDLKSLDFGMHLVKIETSQGVLHKTILKQQ